MKRYIFPLLFLALTVLHGNAQSTITPYTFSTIAGELEVDGQGEYQDGTNGQAQFGDPASIAVDSAGNLYVSDYVFNTIRKITPQGTDWVVSGLAGDPGFVDQYGYTAGGYGDGVGTGALFNGPIGLAVDGPGNVYVADCNNNAIRKITPDGTVTTIAGNPYNMSDGSYVGGYSNAIGTNALFDHPNGIAVDTSGNLYVADTDNNCIRKITPTVSLSGDTWTVTTLAGSPNDSGLGAMDGQGAGAQFNYPQGLAVDTTGNVYVADTQNNTIRKITPGGLVSTFAGDPPTFQDINDFYNGFPFGNIDGTPGIEARFFFPYAVAVDAAGSVYVADTYNNEIRKITPPAGTVSTLGGTPKFTLAFNGGSPYPAAEYGNGSGATAGFALPAGVAVDNAGNVYVADEDNFVIRKGVAPVVQVVALEVTQVIQDWSNSIPLVMGKETYVRAHLQLPQNNNGPVMMSGAVLYGTVQFTLGPDLVLPGPLTPINPGAMLNVQTTNAADPTIRGHLTNTLNFRLPDSWIDGSLAGGKPITLQLAWSGGLVPVNVVDEDCSVQVPLVPAVTPVLQLFDVQWTNVLGQTNKLNSNILTDVGMRVLSCFPVPNINVTNNIYPWPVAAQPNLMLVDRLLAKQRMTTLGSAKSSQFYHGLISAPQIGGITLDPLTNFVSCANYVTAYGNGRTSTAHELGHNLGIDHDVDAGLFGETVSNGVTYALGAHGEIGKLTYIYPLFELFSKTNYEPTLGPLTEGTNNLIYGFDSLTYHQRNLNTNMEPVLSPVAYASVSPTGTVTNWYFDLLSYCRTGGLEERWPSSVTYKTMLTNINRLAGPPPSVPTPMDAPKTYLVIGGEVDFQAGTAQFLPCQTITSATPLPEPPAGTNFLVEALDSSGDLLQSVEFALEPPLPEEGTTNSTSSFFASVPYSASIHSLRLYSNGTLLATLTASAHAPTVTLTTPNGGQTYSGDPINIAWSGNDVDGDTLTYDVSYSADGGTTWTALVVDWPMENITISSAELAATTRGLIQVAVSDGFNTASAQSATTFTIQPHPPAVSINSPPDGSVAIGDQQLFLDARATDLQDGMLNGANVQWRSDRDGALGSDAILNFSAKTLSEGYHTLTVTATDAAGLTNSATAHLLVLHYPSPELSIQTFPGIAGFYPAYATITWPSYYTNYVLQGSSNLISGWVALSNNPPQTVANMESVRWNLSQTNSFFRLTTKP